MQLDDALALVALKLKDPDPDTRHLARMHLALLIASSDPKALRDAHIRREYHQERQKDPRKPVSVVLDFVAHRYHCSPKTVRRALWNKGTKSA